MSEDAGAIVAEIIANWSANFARLDASALASLYSQGAFFFGSNPKLYRGQQGVAAYFEGLPRWKTPRVSFSDVNSAFAAPNIINMAAIASFDLGEEARPLTVKMTWVILRESGHWKIVNHHVSSPTALLAQATS